MIKIIQKFGVGKFGVYILRKLIKSVRSPKSENVVNNYSALHCSKLRRPLLFFSSDFMTFIEGYDGHCQIR